MRVLKLLLLVLLFFQSGIYCQESKFIPSPILKDINILLKKINSEDQIVSDSLIFCVLDSIYGDSKEKKDPIALANYYSLRAERNYQNNNYSEARSDINTCIDICKSPNLLSEEIDTPMVSILAFAYVLLAKITYELNLTDLSTNYIRNSIKNFLLIGDTIAIAYNYQVLAKMFIYKEDYNLAEEFIEKSVYYNSNGGHRVDLQLLNLVSQVEIYLIRDDIDNAKVLIDKSLELSDKLSIKALFLQYLIRADYFIKIMMIDSANYFIQRAEENMATNSLNYYEWQIIQAKMKVALAQKNYKVALNMANKLELVFNKMNLGKLNHKRLKLLKQKIDIYEYLKEYKSAFYWQEVLDNLSDSLNLIKSKGSLRMLENLNEIESEKSNQEIELLKLKEKRQSDILFITILVFVLILAVFIVILLVFKSRLIGKKKELLERDALIKDLEINQQKLDLDRLERQAVSNSMLIEAKNRIYQGLNEFLTDIRSPLSLNNTHYDKLKTEIGTSLKLDNDWNKMTRHYNDINTRFYHNLEAKYPELTNEELKLCAYLRLNLSNKDISRMLNITDDAVTKRRHRLRKKLGLNSAENFFRFFNDESLIN